jgi:hypothetical protein
LRAHRNAELSQQILQWHVDPESLDSVAVDVVDDRIGDAGTVFWVAAMPANSPMCTPTKSASIAALPSSTTTFLSSGRASNATSCIKRIICSTASAPVARCGVPTMDASFALDSLSPFGPIPIAAARPKPSEDEPALSV